MTSIDVTDLGEVFSIKMKSLEPGAECQHVEVAADATLGDLLSKADFLDGCLGCLAASTARGNDDDDDDYDELSLGLTSSDLAERLAANGGTLLIPSDTLASYGIDSNTCSEITLFAVYEESERQPQVFKEDMQSIGLGENVYKYVKLHKEEKTLVDVRKYFKAPLFPWLQKEANDLQTVAFSMEDDFNIDEPMTVLTAHIISHENGLHITCINLAGTVACCASLSATDLVSTLHSCLCEKLQWSDMACWDETKRLSPTSLLSEHSLLTIEQTHSFPHVNGCYACHKNDCRPAGYSASGTSSSDILVLEPGKAGLQSHFRGDYKRAEELRQMVMTDARWSVDVLGSSEYVVRIVGKATFDRYLVHERCGHDGPEIRHYQCYAMVTIPIPQLERAQTETHHHTSTEGSGWSCGSEDYKCSFHLPMCLLEAIRAPLENEGDTFLLRQALNTRGTPDYPYNIMGYAGRTMRSDNPKLSKQTVDMLRHFRERLAGETPLDVEKIQKLQDSMPVLEARIETDADNVVDEDGL